MSGRVLAGRYELHEPVGGSSWRATDTELGREVLVRLGHRADDPGTALSHPNIARVFDSGEADGERYAVLEYLPGGSLARRGELSDAAAEDVAAALAYAHSLGVAHGSLTAESILFDVEGRAKIVGFGGAGDPAADRAAFDALVAEYGGTAVTPPEAPTEPTTLIQRPAVPQRRQRRTAIVLAAVVIAAAGLGAALLAASDDSSSDRTTDSLSVPVPTASDTAGEETEPAPPPTTDGTTTEQTTTAETEPATTETQPPTTEAPPLLPTEPVPTLEPPPTTIEPPPTTFEPPPTTEIVPP